MICIRQKGFKDPYGGNCPHCSNFVVLNDNQIQPPRARIEEVNGRKYILDPCPYCQTPIYVDLVVRQSDGIGGSPRLYGIFRSGESLRGLPEPPKREPLPQSERPTHREIIETERMHEYTGKGKQGLNEKMLEQINTQFPPVRKKELKLE